MTSPATNDPYATQIERLRDMEQYVGRELGLTEWFQITQEDVDTFARVTDDAQWIHVDPIRAKTDSPYGTTIVHGFLILSLISKAAYATYSIGDARMGLNYGLNKVRFPQATPVGAMIRARVSLLDFTNLDPGVARYTLKIIFEIQDQEKPACVGEFLAQAYT